MLEKEPANISYLPKSNRPAGYNIARATAQLWHKIFHSTIIVEHQNYLIWQWATSCPLAPFAIMKPRNIDTWHMTYNRFTEKSDKNIVDGVTEVESYTTSQSCSYRWWHDLRRTSHNSESRPSELASADLYPPDSIHRRTPAGFWIHQLQQFHVFRIGFDRAPRSTCD